MDSLIRLTRPTEIQFKYEDTPKELSEGFNYPTFRLLNKQSRVTLSNPLHPDPATPQQLFAAANLKGWFAAVTFDASYAIVLSPLDELRQAAKQGGIFIPRRRVPLASQKPNIICFAVHETRLLVGLEKGQILIYDTSALFSSGTNDVTPLHVYQSQSSSPLRQISPNPGVEESLEEIIAVVHGDGVVHLLNGQLQSTDGWTGVDDTTPVGVSWSPKGKHIAIGLRSGDVLTFSLTNKSTPHKQIPPAALPPLASIDWIGPAHTFRTSYAAPAPNADPALYIVTLNQTKPLALHFQPTHPYPISDRPHQQAFTVTLPKWDEDPNSTESKTLLVVGDASSVDIEVLGTTKARWYQQSQENPLTLPLDKDTEDTMLLALAADLTDMSISAPIIYAYLNDGTLQGWYLDHSKPYLGIVTPAISSPPPVNDDMTGQQQSSGVPDQQPLTSAFVQQSTPSVFGGAATSAFGQPSFSQPHASPMSGFESTQTPSPFGAPATGAAFGRSGIAIGGGFSGNAFGRPPGGGAFGALTSSGTTNTFGQGSFGSFGASSSPARPADPPATGMTREASMSDSTPSSISGLSLGEGNATSPGVFGSFSSSAPTAGQPSSTFGSSGFGSAIKPASGFGAFSSYQTQNNSEGSDQDKIVGPAPVFSGTKSSAPSFGQSGFAAAKPQSAFGQSSFGQSGFGQSAFTAKPSVPVAPTVSGGGFGAFASGRPATFTGASQQGSDPPRSVFASTGSTFGGQNSSSSSRSEPPQSAFPVEGSAFGKPSNNSAFGGISSSGSSVFGGGDSTFSGANNIAIRAPVKPKDTTISPPSSPETTPRSSPLMPSTPKAFQASPASNAFSNLATSSSVFKPATGFGAFGSDSMPTSSPFYKRTETTPPIAAFATLGSTTSSPATPVSTPTFGAPSVLGSNKSVFAPPTPPSPSPAATTASTSGGFSAFSGANSGFSAYAGSKSSFGGLLKQSGDASDPAKAPATSKAPESTSENLEAKPKPPVPALGPDAPKYTSPVYGSIGIFGGPTSKPNEKAAAPTSVFGNRSWESGSGTNTPKLDRGKEKPGPLVSVFFPPSTGELQSATAAGNAREPDEGSRAPSGKQASDDPSLGSLSLSSESSFVEVSQAEDSEAEGDHNVTEHSDEDGDDNHSFLSESFSSDTDDSSSEEEGQDEDEGDDEGSAVSSPPEPTTIPLPASRSPSETPHPEVPEIHVTPSPPASDESESSEASGLSTITEESSTPPGTPTKESKKPPGSSAAPLPFGLGLGRPSTRPARSSPLASTPVSGEDEEEKEKERQDSVELKVEQSPKILVSPKPRSGALPTLKTESLEENKGSSIKKSPRPKTPPLLSSFGAPSMVVPDASETPIPMEMTTPLGSGPLGIPRKMPAPPSISYFTSQTSSIPSSGLSSSSSVPVQPFGSDPFFASPTPTKSEISRASIPSIFGSGPFSSSPVAPGSNPSLPKSTFNLATFNTQGATSTPPLPKSLFGNALPASSQSVFKPIPLVPTPSHFVPAETTVQALPIVLPQAPPATSPTHAPEVTMEEGMQKECTNLFCCLERELQDLRTSAQAATTKRMELGKSDRGSRRKEDLGDVTKWGLGDLAQFGQVMKQYEGDIVQLKGGTSSQQQSLRELQSNMLKAGTRREEIARFNRAKKDNEFAKMLKSRTLGPEHLETQTQLRRNIRVMRDRVQKLEDNLQTSKRKLSEINSGKPNFRAPSLDTINRTYRNIDIAIQQQADEVAKLTSRISKLSVAAPINAPAERDPRLPDLVTRRPYNVTPHVAVTTAAALNAERSAQKLKRALLSVRKEPLLNNKAAAAPPPMDAFNTPQKPVVLDFGFKTPLPGPLFTPDSTPQPASMNWTLPADNFNPSPLQAVRRGAGTVTRKHNSVPLKRTAGGLPAVSFDWGPMPTYKEPGKPVPVKITVPMATPAAADPEGSFGGNGSYQQ